MPPATTRPLFNYARALSTRKAVLASIGSFSGDFRASRSRFSKIELIGIGGLRAYISFTHIAQPIAQSRPAPARSLDMKTLSVLCIALCFGLSTGVAFARGGMGGAHGLGSPHMSTMGGGNLGTTAAAPGTNSSGTALSSGGVGRPMLDAVPSIDSENAKIDKEIDKEINSICRGC